MIAKTVLASVATILFALVIQNANAEYNVAQYCQLVPSGTRMPSFDSCQNYYTCNSDGTVTAASCTSTQSFDKNSQSCTASSAVNCYYGLSNPCANKNNVFVPNVSNCNGWIWCANNAQKGSGNCGTGQVFDAVKGACVYGSCDNDGTGNSANDVQNVCEIMKSGAWFGSFDNCARWNTCNNLEITTGLCQSGLVYNTQQQMCLKNDGTMCDRTNGAAPSPPQIPCNPSNIDQLQGDENVCSVYYKCTGLKWQQLQCLVGQYFDVPSTQCTSRQLATPEADCNRCQYTNYNFVNAVDPNCQEFLMCTKGVQTGKGTCADDQFFNEERQGCIVGTNGLQTYAGNNGACAAVVPAPPEVTTEEVTTEEATTKELTTEEVTTKDPKDD